MQTKRLTIPENFEEKSRLEARQLPSDKTEHRFEIQQKSSPRIDPNPTWSASI